MDLKRELSTFWTVYAARRRPGSLPQHALLPVVDPARLRLHFPKLVERINRTDWITTMDSVLGQHEQLAEHLHKKLHLPLSLLQVMLPDTLCPGALWQLHLLEQTLWPGVKTHTALALGRPKPVSRLFSGPAAASAYDEIHRGGSADCVMFLTLVQAEVDPPPMTLKRSTQQQLHLASCWRDARSGLTHLRNTLLPDILFPQDYMQLISPLNLRDASHVRFLDQLLQDLGTAPAEQHPHIVNTAKKERNALPYFSDRSRGRR